jgi:hypothetical protein
MPYIAPNDQFYDLAGATWYYTAEIRRAVRIAQQSNFSLVASRQLVRDAFTDIDVREPFNLNSRFDDSQLYTCADRETWPKLFQMLYSSLDYKEGDKDSKKPGNARKPAPIDGDVEPEKPWNFNDASQQFRNAVREMQIAMNQRVATYRQASFERSFNYNWTESTISQICRTLIEQYGFNDTNFCVGNTRNLAVDWAWPGTANTRLLGVMIRQPNQGADVINPGDNFVVWGTRREHNARGRIGIARINNVWEIVQCQAVPTAD